MIFGDRISESPRVPSPWTAVPCAKAAEQRTTSTRRSLGRTNDGSSSRSSQSSRSSSATHTPPMRSIARRSALSSSKGTMLSESTTAVIDGRTRPDNGSQDDISDSASTPPTDDSDQDGFFCLDADLDLDKMNLAGTVQAPDTSLLVEDKSTEAELAAAHALSRLAPEPDVRGNLEYKLRILPHTRHRYDRLLTQLKWRMLQGGGQCTYEVGVLDDGDCIGICAIEMHNSLRVLTSMAEELEATVSIQRAFEVEEGPDDTMSDLQMVPLAAQRVRELLLSAPDAQPEMCACGVSSKHLDELLSFLPPFQESLVELELGPEPGGGSLSDASTRPHWQHATTRESATIASVGTDCTTVSHAPDADAVLPVHEEKLPDLHFLTDAADEDLEAADEDGVTFSLSLDEQATRLGMGYQRKAMEPRRKCRYNARSAQQRQRNAVEEAKAAAAAALEAEQQTACLDDGLVATSATADSVAAAPTSIPIESGPSCTRVILEVCISRSLGHDAFIDYASL